MDKTKIINKHFSRAVMGYDIEEVDAFLDEIVRDIDRSEQELSVARLRIRMLLEELQANGLLHGRSITPDGAADEQAAGREDAAKRQQTVPEAQESGTKDGEEHE